MTATVPLVDDGRGTGMLVREGCSHWWFKRLRSQRGASAVEFALISLPLMTLMLGMLQYGWYFFVAQSASSAARESARRLVVGDLCQPSTAAENFAKDQASLSTLTLTFGSPGATATDFASGTQGTLPSVGDTLRVVVKANGSVLNFLPIPDGGRVQRVVDARVEDRNDQGGTTCP